MCPLGQWPGEAGRLAMHITSGLRKCNLPHQQPCTSSFLGEVYVPLADPLDGWLCTPGERNWPCRPHTPSREEAAQSRSSPPFRTRLPLRRSTRPCFLPVGEDRFWEGDPGLAYSSDAFLRSPRRHGDYAAPGTWAEANLRIGTTKAAPPAEKPSRVWPHLGGGTGVASPR